MGELCPELALIGVNTPNPVAQDWVQSSSGKYVGLGFFGFEIEGEMRLNKQGYWKDSNLGLLHRHAYKTAYGKIPKNWIVHHIDGDKQNNSISNLIAMPWHCHDQMHSIERAHKVNFSRSQLIAFIVNYVEGTKFLEQQQKEVESSLEEIKRLIKKRNSTHIPRIKNA